MNNNAKDIEVAASVDFLPNWVRSGQTKTVEDFLRKNFEKSLPGKIKRYGELPVLLVLLSPFDLLIREARALYIDEYYKAAVALCGMTIESLCIAIAEERVKDESLKKQLTNSHMDCRQKLGSLKKYFRIAKSEVLVHQVLDIRNDYLHLHKIKILPEEALKCINTLHLAAVAEYGLVSAAGGKVRFVTCEDIEELARKMGIQL